MIFSENRRPLFGIMLLVRRATDWQTINCCRGLNLPAHGGGSIVAVPALDQKNSARGVLQLTFADTVQGFWRD
jgi:hypothetical protein